MDWEYGLDGMLQVGTVGKVVLYRQQHKIWLRPIMTTLWSVGCRPGHITLKGLPDDEGMDRESFLRSLAGLSLLEGPLASRTLGPQWPEEIIEQSRMSIFGHTIGCSYAAYLGDCLYLAGNAYFAPVKRKPRSWQEWGEWLSDLIESVNDRTTGFDAGGPTGPPVHVAIVQRCICDLQLRLVTDDMIGRQDINWYITWKEEE